MLSINQMNAQCKLLDTWKTLNVEGHPYKPSLISREENTSVTRACANGMLIENARSNISQNTFRNDAIHIWNKVPDSIKGCNSIYSVKKAIKTFVATLPI